MVGSLNYDAQGRLSQACDPLGQCSRTVHDLNNRSETVIESSGGQTSYTYDERGNVLTQTDALGNTTSFEYDEDDKVVRAEGPDGSVATYDYDANGQLIERVLPHEPDEDAADFTYGYSYNYRKKRTSVTLPSGGSIWYAPHLIRTTYVAISGVVGWAIDPYDVVTTLVIRTT